MCQSDNGLTPSVSYSVALVSVQQIFNGDLPLDTKNLFEKEYVSGRSDGGRCFWSDSLTLLGEVSLRMVRLWVSYLAVGA